MAVGNGVELRAQDLTTVPVAPGRRRWPWLGMAFTAAAALALVASVWLLVASGLQAGDLEAAGVLFLVAAAVLGSFGLVGLRMTPRGRLRVAQRGGALYLPGVLGGNRVVNLGAWAGLLCAWPLARARAAGVDLGSGMLTLGLWLGLLLGLLAVGGRVTTGRPHAPLVLLRLDPQGVEYSWPTGRAGRAWDEVSPMSSGPHPVGDAIAPGDARAGAAVLASDPDAVARLVEHYRTHPEDRAELGRPDVIALLPQRAAIVPPR